MPHIATVPPSEASGDLAAIYRQIETVMGVVPAAFQLASLSPELLRHQWASISYYLGHPTLSGALLAFMRLSVSTEIHCDYCIGLNGGLLVNHYGWTLEQLAAAKRDLEAAPLSDREKALLRYSLDAVRSLGRVEPERIDALRKMGWADRDIFDAVSHAARNVASDIVLNTFGVESEPGW